MSLGPTSTEQDARRSLARLAERVDAHERHRSGHAARMARMAERLARRLRLGEEEVADVQLAALCHGFGLYALRLGALERVGPLTLAERAELWRHPLLAEQQLAKRGASRHAQLLVRWHHEWWSGLGYPDMLAGDEIPVGARILRIVETYDAVRSDRPHRPALDEPAARETVARGAGIEFDPAIAAVFLDLVEAEPELDGGAVDADTPPRLNPIAPPAGDAR